jgi:hypothetical protein
MCFIQNESTRGENRKVYRLYARQEFSNRRDYQIIMAKKSTYSARRFGIVSQSYSNNKTLGMHASTFMCGKCSGGMKNNKKIEEQN